MQTAGSRPTRLAARMARALDGLVARMRGAAEAKSSRVAPLIALDGNRQPVWAPRDYASFAREGLMQNPVAFRAVRMIAEAAASVPLLLYDRDTEVEDHWLLDVLARPAPGQIGVDLLEALFSSLLVSGNAYVEAVATADGIRELHVLRADRVQVIPGADGWSDGYAYTAGGQTVRIAGDVVPGTPRILHLRFYHPLNDHYGLSPIEAAATAIDIHNEAARWNKALLDNSARPSGALVYGAGEAMSPSQFERLKKELEDSFQGARNAGRPLLLEGGLDWKSMSFSPRDMDFIALKQMAAREIALALGVPPLLLGLPGDNTYSNYQEANRTFWRQTVIPLSVRVAKSLSAWLGQGLELRCDLDALDALAPDREALWARLDGASFLTEDEKRAAAPRIALRPRRARRACPRPRSAVGEARRRGLPHPGREARGGRVRAGGGSRKTFSRPDRKVSAGSASRTCRQRAGKRQVDRRWWYYPGCRSAGVSDKHPGGRCTRRAHLCATRRQIRGVPQGKDFGQSDQHCPGYSASAECVPDHFRRSKAANKLVNSTIAENSTAVEAFKNGRSRVRLSVALRLQTVQLPHGVRGLFSRWEHTASDSTDLRDNRAVSSRTPAILKDTTFTLLGHTIRTSSQHAIPSRF